MCGAKVLASLAHMLGWTSLYINYCAKLMPNFIDMNYTFILAKHAIKYTSSHDPTVSACLTQVSHFHTFSFLWFGIFVVIHG